MGDRDPVVVLEKGRIQPPVIIPCQQQIRHHRLKEFKQMGNKKLGKVFSEQIKHR